MSGERWMRFWRSVSWELRRCWPRMRYFLTTGQLHPEVTGRAPQGYTDAANEILREAESARAKFAPFNVRNDLGDQ